MAMTVTATMSGTPANEHIYLWIRVLTGAAEAGGASVASLNAAGGASVTASLTPNFSNSLPCFALTADNWGGSYTAATSNTIDSNTNDPDDWGAGFGRYTGTVTAGTPLTFGASGVGGGCDYSTWACYEVPASGGTVTVDGSSPVLASATGAGVKTVTSASFTPPAGSVVVAMVCGGGTGTSGTFTIAVTDTGGGLTWTKRAGNTTAADQNTAVFTATAGGASPAPWPLFQPGSRNWRRTHSRRQQLVPPNVAGLPVTAPATLAAAGSISTAMIQDAGATLAAAGSLAASPGPPCITGLGGTGAGYFKDQGGSPRMVLGDAAWALPGNAGRWNSGNWQADFDTYLASRASQGFTVIYTKPIGTVQSGNLDSNGKTFDALYPFQGGTPSTGVAAANPSSGLTAAFWARIDYFLASALAKGITVFLNAIGYSSDFDGGPGPLAGKSSTEFQAYGAALGARYASQPNLVWTLADDYFGDNDALITAFLTGLTGAGDTHVVSIENFAETTSRQALDTGSATAWGVSHGQFNFCYSYNVTYYGVEKAYLESSPIPVIQGDGYFYQGNATYAGGSGAFAYDRAIRQDAWHAISSGARGIIHGSESIWQWASTSLAASGTDWYYVNNAGAIRALIESLPGWHTLVPDTSSALITAGRGTHASAFSSGGGGGQYEVAFTDSYVTGSRTPDGGSGSALAVIYLSHGTTITIDQTKMVSGYTATWADPVTGATSAATAGATYNSTAKGSNSQGDPDWVLILQAPTGVAGAATLAGAGSLTAAATQRAGATLTGTGSVTAAAAQQAAATLSGTGAVTTAVTQRAGATLSGTGSAAATSAQQAGATLAAAASIGDAAAQQSGGALGGAGSLATAAIQGTSVTLAGTGVLSAAVTQLAAATLTGAGSVTGTGTSTGATMTGAASLSALSALLAPAVLAGAGSLSAAAAQLAASALAGTGTIGSPPSAQRPAGTLTGTASLSAAAIQLAPATLAGAGSLTGTGTAGGGTSQGAATLTAAGSLTALGVQRATALLAGAGTLAATATVTLRAAAVLAGAGSLTAAGGAQAPFTVGTLTAADAPLATLGASAATAGTATLTASDARTGGPS